MAGGRYRHPGRAFGCGHIVMSESYMTDINVLYYMDILRSLKEKGYINIVAMIQNGTVIPERYRWITGPEVSRIAFY